MEEAVANRVKRVALNEQGVHQIAEAARANGVSTREYLEALMHFGISCFQRPGSWEAQSFELWNYVGPDSCADRWF
jgi:hypothetical protein